MVLIAFLEDLIVAVFLLWMVICIGTTQHINVDCQFGVDYTLKELGTVHIVIIQYQAEDKHLFIKMDYILNVLNRKIMKTNFNLAFYSHYFLFFIIVCFTSFQLYSQNYSYDSIYLKRTGINNLKFFKNEKHVKWTEIRRLSKGNDEAEYHLKKIDNLRIVASINALIAGLAVGFGSGNLSNGNSTIPIVILTAAGLVIIGDIIYVDGIMKEHMKSITRALNNKK